MLPSQAKETLRLNKRQKDSVCSSGPQKRKGVVSRHSQRHREEERGLRSLALTLLSSLPASWLPRQATSPRSYSGHSAARGPVSALW